MSESNQVGGSLDSRDLPRLQNKCPLPGPPMFAPSLGGLGHRGIQMVYREGANSDLGSTTCRALYQHSWSSLSNLSTTNNTELE